MGLRVNTYSGRKFRSYAHVTLSDLIVDQRGHIDTTSQISENMWLFKLPEIVSFELLSEWLDAIEFAKLETSICNTELKLNFRKISGHPKFTLKMPYRLNERFFEMGN